MSFILNNWSSVGNEGRRGKSPLIHSYITEDPDSGTGSVRIPGYFNEVKNKVNRGDWIEATIDSDSGVVQHCYFILGDGASPSLVNTYYLTAAGSGYAVGDLLYPTFTDGTVIWLPYFKVASVNSGAITGLDLIDPGLFDKDDMPTDFTKLATTTDGSGTNATITVWPTFSNSTIDTVSINDGGTGYADGDILQLNFSDGTVYENPVLEVTGETGGVIDGIQVNNPGSFDIFDLPTTITALTSTTLSGTGAGNDDATFDLAGDIWTVVVGDQVDTNAGDVTLDKKTIRAAT